MKFLYFGSFHVSAWVLERLIDAGFIPTAVICSPDRPAGRKKVLTAPPVKTLIANRKVQSEILQPENVNDSRLALSALRPDVAIVMGYPKIIGRDLLALPRLGTIGVHPSLLPKYRGASPIQSALLNDESETGVTLYQMDEKMDHGQILSQSEYCIAQGTPNTELEKNLANLAADMLIELMPKLIAGKVKPREQDHSQATFTKKFTSADAEVNMEKDDPLVIYRKIKALNPEPGAWTMNFPGREGKRVKLLEAEYRNNEISVIKIQPEGKKPMMVDISLP